MGGVKCLAPPEAARDGPMKIRFFLLLTVLLAMCLSGAAAAADFPIPLNHLSQDPIGTHAGYLKEMDSELTLQQAIAAYAGGKFTAGNSQVLSFGIGSQPVWIHFSVSNGTKRELQRRLSIETAWLDQLDVY